MKRRAENRRPTRRAAREKGRGGGGGERKEGGRLHSGEGGRGFRTRLCFQAGSPRSRLSLGMIARAGLNF